MLALEVRFRSDKEEITTKLTQEGYVPKTVRVGLNKTEYELLENKSLSQLTGLVQRPTFNLCKKKIAAQQLQIQ